MEQDKKQAAALKYDEENNNAPEIVALGKGEVAGKIIDTAKESGVPIYENAPLAESLNKLSIGQEIPRELYDVVAQVLIFVAQLDETRRRKV